MAADSGSQLLQAHPDLRSRPTAPHPLFRGLIGAAIERHRSSELFGDDES